MSVTPALSRSEAGIDLAHWLRLEQTPGVGPATARRLLSAFGLPEQIFNTDLDALLQVVTLPVAQALSQAVPGATAALIDATLLWLEQAGNHIVTLVDGAFPPELLNIPDPPLLLYVKGRLDLLHGPSLAVVGSRNASAQGAANAERFSYHISEAGLTIVSGLALGIDAAAHKGGLRGAASTIAVIGTGADLVYPSRNRALAHLIAQQGAIVSEYPLGLPALSSNFPRRNRLISGLARGVLVIEAAAGSGSLITARMALEQGRDVFAVPGSIHSALSKGCHGLIKQGAKLVESADDILEELLLPSSSKKAANPALANPGAERTADGRDAAPTESAPQPDLPLESGLETHPLLNVLGHDPVDADLLAERAGLDAASVISQLLTLELAGLVERLPGGLFARCKI